MKINLLQNLYLNRRRDQEHLFCLRKNNDNPHIGQIFLLVEKITAPLLSTTEGMAKCKLIETGRSRESYEDCFRVAAELVAPGELVILANLDIFFDDSIARLADFRGWPDSVLALTRWDYRENRRSRLFRVDNSQDVWIWRAPLETHGLITDFALGDPGCDNRIAYELAKNYRVINPCKTIKCYHYHQSGCRDYTMVEKVPPPYKTLPHAKFPRPVRQTGWQIAGFKRLGGKLRHLYSVWRKK